MSRQHKFTERELQCLSCRDIRAKYTNDGFPRFECRFNQIISAGEDRICMYYRKRDDNGNKIEN